MSAADRFSTRSLRRSSCRTATTPGCATACGESAICSALACARPDSTCTSRPGTYFITTDAQPLGEKDGVEFCRALPGRCGVVAIPNAVFYDDAEAGRSQVRFAFCKRDEVLAEAAVRLARLRRD